MMSEADLPKYEKAVIDRIGATSSCSGAGPCSALDEFELMDKLATMVGVSGPESGERRNASVLYKRHVLRAAIAALENAWKNSSTTHSQGAS